MIPILIIIVLVLIIVGVTISNDTLAAVVPMCLIFVICVMMLVFSISDQVTGNTDTESAIVKYGTLPCQLEEQK